jgi:hypothetical protein
MSFRCQRRDLLPVLVFFLITFAPVGIAVAMICDMER